MRINRDFKKVDPKKKLVTDAPTDAEGEVLGRQIKDLKRSTLQENKSKVRFDDYIGQDENMAKKKAHIDGGSEEASKRSRSEKWR